MITDTALCEESLNQNAAAKIFGIQTGDSWQSKIRYWLLCQIICEGVGVQTYCDQKEWEQTQKVLLEHNSLGMI